jgi:hypothetical protein
MSEWSVDIRDVRFNLFDFLNVGDLSKYELYQEYDAEMMGDVVDAARDQCTNLLAPLQEVGDATGLRFEGGRVHLPEGFSKAYQAFREAGWIGLSHRVEHGGMGFPFVMNAVTQAMFSGANLSFMFTPGLTTGAAGLIADFGTEEHHATYLGKMLSGEWTGTMCLTEAGAGTAVPDLKTAAFPVDPDKGVYKIKGQKVFISAGDHDLTENIVHMVLARVDGDPAGAKGVSLFIVPVRRADAAGSAGEFNDVTTVGIEHKLGIHASPTCTLSFGDNDDCLGYLIGGKGQGLGCMFRMMNEARIAVALQGVGLAAASYQKALAYAKERVQGTHITEMRNPDAARVAIIEHPDVRRNLMWMKALSEGSLAMTLYAAYCADREMTATEPKEKQRWEYQVEILTPIVKAWCSDEAFRAAELGIQVLGGYGYCREYGLEQYLRDAKILSLYEGTNGIQALDLLGRKIGRKGGVMMMTVLNEVNSFVNGDAANGPLAAEIVALGKARDAVASTAMGFAQRMMKGDMVYGALHATPFLQMFGDLLVGWLLTKQAATAQDMLEAKLAELGVAADQDLGPVLADHAEARYLHGKVATAKFFCHHILPRVRARKSAVDSGDTSALDVVL